MKYMKRVQEEDIQLINLTEARRSPELNPRVSAYEALKPYKDNPDIYISFTEVDKLGINPKSGYNTPLGIYTYPLKEIWKEYDIDKKKSVGKAVPFAGDHPYIWVVRRTARNFIEDLYKYSSKDFDNDKQELSKYIEDHFPTLYDTHPEIPNFRVLLEKAKRLAQDYFGYISPSYLIWSLTREFAQLLVEKKGGKHSVKWNYVFREILGYSGVADKSGRGIIHFAEDIQAVFFHTRAFKVEAQFLNKDYEKLTSPPWFDVAHTKDAKWTYEKTSKFVKFVWLNGIWKSGSWHGGVWEEGLWEDGIWEEGLWKNGVWRDGVWKGGLWENGTWENGEFHYGTWKDGLWENGTMYKGTWKDGFWENGEWKDGLWMGGVWKQGIWRSGWIVDNDLKGNYDPSWKQTFPFSGTRAVQSPISPAEYWKGVK